MQWRDDDVEVSQEQQRKDAYRDRKTREADERHFTIKTTVAAGLKADCGETLAQYIWAQTNRLSPMYLKATYLFNLFFLQLLENGEVFDCSQGRLVVLFMQVRGVDSPFFKPRTFTYCTVIVHDHG